MSLNEDVLRYLTLKVDELDEGPSIPAQNIARNERSSNSYNTDKAEKEPEAANQVNHLAVSRLSHVAN